MSNTYPPELKAQGRDLYIAWRAGEIPNVKGEPKKVSRYVARRLGIGVQTALYWCNGWAREPEIAAIIEQRRAEADDEAFSMARSAAVRAARISRDKDESGKTRVEACRTVIGYLSVRSKARAEASKAKEGDAPSQRAAVNIEIVYPADADPKKGDSV